MEEWYLISRQFMSKYNSIHVMAVISTCMYIIHVIILKMKIQDYNTKQLVASIKLATHGMWSR